MWATGTLLNLLTVLAGGLVGTVLGDRLPPRLRENVVAGVGLFVAVMGVKFAIDTASLNGTREANHPKARLIQLTGDTELVLGTATRARWHWVS